MNNEKQGFLGKFCGRINAVLGSIQVAAIIFAAVMVTADVLMRAIFSKPISGTSEYVGYIMIMASFFGLGACTADRSHLKVDLLVQMLSEKAQIVNDLINSVLVAAVATVMVYASVNQGIITFGLKTKGTFSGVPNWPFYLLMGLGYFPVLVGSAANFAEDIRSLIAMSAKKNIQEGE